MRIHLLIIALAMATLAGCLDGDSDVPMNDEETVVTPNVGMIPVPQTATFTESVVLPAVSITNDLYEPTLDVSDTGAIYITGHTLVVDTTGAPVYGSYDDGENWEQLPFLGPATLPSPVPGATPPPTDEIFLVAGDNGWLYGVDITLATYPVNAWRDNGAELAYHNPNAYDETQAVMQALDCQPVPAKDRPWAAYANGTLLMVSNPAGGPAQVGVMSVPMDRTLSVGSLPQGVEWNLCAGPGGSIPGIPDIREDGFFAVPQLNGGALTITTGYADNVYNTVTKAAFNNTNGGQITSHYGQAIFDGEGTLFVGAGNNTRPDDDGVRDGGFQIAVSTDNGESYETVRFATGAAITQFYMDGNTYGPGILVSWAQANPDGGHDYYVAHIYADDNGVPFVGDAFLAIEGGPAPSAHVTGAAAGPDGRAYLATYSGGGPLSTPLSVWIQQDGPVLPVA